MGVNDSPLAAADAALIAFAAAIADGDGAWIAAAIAELVQQQVEPIEVDELILQSVLTVGWPRALVAAGAWRTAIGSGPTILEQCDYGAHADWTSRGEATCAIIYGNHYQRLRENVRALHPALESWMITEGYGRTLSRTGLALKSRELCTVVQTAVLRTPRQLHSHLLGAVHAGASADEIDATLEIARPRLSAAAWAEVVGVRSRLPIGRVA